MKIMLLTAMLLMIVMGVALRPAQEETDRKFAEKLLESTQVRQLQLSDSTDPPVFQAASRTALFFERQGMQDRIRGVVVVEGTRVVDLVILQSREGLDRKALDSPKFLMSFRDKSAKPPLIVDAVSGATISSQAVTDAVNLRLAQWEEYSQKKTDIHSLK